MEKKSGRWGFTVRDKNGAAVMARAGRLDSVHDAFCAEAQACLTALTAISAQGMTRIQLESDSPNLVSALKSSAFDQSSAGFLLRKARQDKLSI
jgi:ribonuclease HI